MKRLLSGMMRTLGHMNRRESYSVCFVGCSFYIHGVLIGVRKTQYPHHADNVLSRKSKRLKENFAPEESRRKPALCPSERDNVKKKKRAPQGPRLPIFLMLLLAYQLLYNQNRKMHKSKIRDLFCKYVVMFSQCYSLIRTNSIVPTWYSTNK